jgi:hypothetical protein
MSLVIGLVFLLIGSVLFSLVRVMRGGKLFDPGPRSLKELIEQNRTIIHPDDNINAH